MSNVEQKTLRPSPEARDGSSRGLLMFGLTVAVAGSIWAAFFTCAACESSRARIGGINLGLMGIGWYGSLLLATLFQHPTKGVRFSVLLSIGVHPILLLVLMAWHDSCLGCITTAIGAFIAGAAVIRGHALAALAVVPAGLILAVVGMIGGIVYGGPVVIRAANELVAEGKSEEAPAAGHIRMVIYSKPGCEHCRDFKQNTLPKLQQDFPNVLDITEHHVPAELPSPTIILMGPEDRAMPVLGNQPVENFEKAIRLVQTGKQ